MYMARLKLCNFYIKFLNFMANRLKENKLNKIFY